MKSYIINKQGRHSYTVKYGYAFLFVFYNKFDNIIDVI